LERVVLIVVFCQCGCNLPRICRQAANSPPPKNRRGVWNAHRMQAPYPPPAEKAGQVPGRRVVQQFEMKTMKKLYYILMLMCLSIGAKAQDSDAPEQAPTNTTLYADARLDVLMKKHKTGGGSGGGIYSGRGYRVQIYSGADRNKANRMKVDFMRRFPGVQAYMTYVAPQFRVKVGDFRSRAEAGELYRKLGTLYNPCMIVPDMVVFRNFNTNKSKDERSDTE
jgi:hypothetical protein